MVDTMGTADDNGDVMSYLIYLILVVLFAHKQRLIATISFLCYIVYTKYAYNYSPLNTIIIIPIFASLFGVSFINLNNIYLTYLVTAVTPIVMLLTFGRAFLRATEAIVPQWVISML